MSLTYQTRLGEQQLDGRLAGSSPAGWTHLVEDFGDRGVVPGCHSVLAQRLLNELQHCVLMATTGKYVNKDVPLTDATLRI